MLVTYNAPLRGTNTQAIIRSEAKGACVFVSQRAPASDYSGLLWPRRKSPLLPVGVQYPI